MTHRAIRCTIRIAVVAGIFASGYLCGSMPEGSAHAQMGDFGGGLMQKAAGSGGILGSAAQLGTTISDMEKHVSGLQNNLDALRKVKAALGGK